MLDFDLLKDCYGCGACVNVCPRGAVHMTQAADGSYIPEIDEARCIGCGKCANICPAKAIKMKNKLPKIDRSACIHCFCCQEFCPRGAMQVHRTVIARIAGHL